ncbi:MAG: hypothetical protein ACW9WZ_00995 [Nitrosopumilus sp.]
MKSNLYGFLFGMWLLILLGGGILVVIIGPINISGFGDFDLIINSGIKAIIAVTLVIIWVLILSKLKNWIFRKEIKS